MSARLSVTEWVLGEPTTAAAVARVAAAGYGAIELTADPAHRADDLRALLADHGLTVTTLCGVQGPDRDCAHESPRLRRAAADYLRAGLELGRELGASALIVVPTYRPQPPPASEREAELARAADTIARALAGDGRDGPWIALEALNRYETHLVRTLADAERLRGMIDSPRVGLMADVFHMNIEEDSIEEALQTHAAQLVHVHLADNQRREPGTGQLDFASILATLDQVGYSGPLTMEFVPAGDAALRAGREYVERLLGEG